MGGHKPMRWLGIARLNCLSRKTLLLKSPGVAGGTRIVRRGAGGQHSTWRRRRKGQHSTLRCRRITGSAWEAVGGRARSEPILNSEMGIGRARRGWKVRQTRSAKRRGAMSELLGEGLGIRGRKGGGSREEGLSGSAQCRSRKMAVWNGGCGR
jgi:hypothetical protein